MHEVSVVVPHLTRTNSCVYPGRSLSESAIHDNYDDENDFGVACREANSLSFKLPGIQTFSVVEVTKFDGIARDLSLQKIISN